MSTITKERLTALSHRENVGAILGEEIAEMARIALASLEAEAESVAFRSKLKPPAALGGERWGYTDHRQPDAFELENCVIERLFTAPPAPVAVPETLPCPVLLEPGMRFGKGVSTKTMLDALDRRAKYYAELEAMTPEQRAEHDAGMREFAAMLQGADGNSPAIPDGVCPCCGRKPLKNRTCSVSGCDGKHVARGFCIKHYAIERKKDPSRRESIRAADERYRARKAAAPQQEVKNG